MLIVFSVIIPVYNAESTLNRCITSILEQDFQDYEILLIDDGSSDSSGFICDDFAALDKRIKVFHKQNGGVSSARNLGLKNATGRWITFVDADDYIEQDFFPSVFLENGSLVIVNFKTTESDDYIEYLEPGKVVGKKQVKQFVNKYLHLDLLRCPWAKFFERIIIEKKHLLFDDRFAVGEDTLFVMSYLLHCKNIQVESRGLYRYYKRPSKESFVRYRIDFEKSIAYLNTFDKVYKDLHCSNRTVVKLLYNFYKEQTIDIDKSEIYGKWLVHPVVVRMLWLAYYKDEPRNYIYYLKLWFQSVFLRKRFIKKM